jgi:hypothetical protein
MRLREAVDVVERLEELEKLHAEGQRGRLLRDFLIGVLLMQVRV